MAEYEQADDVISDAVAEVINLTRAIADRLDRRRREPSNIAAAATIATWACNSDQLDGLAEQIDDLTQAILEAFGGDLEDGDGEPDPEGEELDGDDELQGDAEPDPDGEPEQAAADPVVLTAEPLP
jgi:hypothetical protein